MSEYHQHVRNVISLLFIEGKSRSHVNAQSGKVTDMADSEGIKMTEEELWLIIALLHLST